MLFPNRCLLKILLDRQRLECQPEDCPIIDGNARC